MKPLGRHEKTRSAKESSDHVCYKLHRSGRGPPCPSAKWSAAMYGAPVEWGAECSIVTDLSIARPSCYKGASRKLILSIAKLRSEAQVGEGWNIRSARRAKLHMSCGLAVAYRGHLFVFVEPLCRWRCIVGKNAWKRCRRKSMRLF